MQEGCISHCRPDIHLLQDLADLAKQKVFVFCLTKYLQKMLPGKPSILHTIFVENEAQIKVCHVKTSQSVKN